MQLSDSRTDQPHHEGQPYRREIDGLRALAILPILFNHIGLRGFGGGYVGVDIFFVISGFLITEIIARDVAQGRFSIAEFYKRRVLRIFPALFLMLMVTAVAALFVLMPGETVRYARSLGATAAFVSNILFYTEAGYFDTASQSKFLLHSWSLAIEEQFYLVWPWLLLLGRGRKGTTLALLIAVSAASFLFSVWQVPRDMSAAFYLLPARAWELGLGGIIALAPAVAIPRWARQLAAALGLAMIGYACWQLYPPIAFPGATALLPCAGTALLILFARGTAVGWLLSLFPAVFIGQISYSLYLWHWPVIVLTDLSILPLPPAAAMAAEILLSLILATLSWRYVERPFRQRRHNLAARPALKVAGMAIGAAGAIALLLASDQGQQWRFSAGQREIAAYADRDYEARFRRGSCFIIEAADQFDHKNCLQREPGRPAIMLLGDSMAAHFWPGLARHRNEFSTLQATMAGCRPNLYPEHSHRRCEIFFRRMLLAEVARLRPAALLISGNWQPEDLPLLRESLPHIRAAGVPVVLIGPVPQYSAALPRLLVFAERNRDESVIRRAIVAQSLAVDRDMARIASAAGVAYASPVRALCRDGTCRTLAAPGVPLQFDYGHLTPEGSAVVTDAILPEIRRAAHLPGRAGVQPAL